MLLDDVAQAHEGVAVAAMETAPAVTPARRKDLRLNPWDGGLVMRFSHRLVVADEVAAAAAV
ncbi:hypothetical protein [Streptomyces vietnamensis]|uniref:hypothetical protein n=1 Tax=Streptomyces vietnamensis TaxID=362257 RepID=UPI003439CA28